MLTQYKKMIFGSRRDAERVLDKLNNLCIHYGQASVADYYDICGISGEYSNSKYGWLNVGSGIILGVDDGYVINLPFPIELGKRKDGGPQTDSTLVKDDTPIILTISQVDLLSKEYIKQEYIDQIGKVACVCGVYKTIRSVKVTEQEVIVELD